MKTCCRCNVPKSSDQFHKDKRRADGLFPQCKECRKAYAKTYYASLPPGASAEYSRKWRAANPGAVTEYSRKWRAANPERAKEISDRYVAKRRARLAEVEHESVDYAELKEVYSDCYLCGETLYEPIEIDHVVPLSKGGPHVWGNLRPTHRSCNRAKSDHSWEDTEA